MAGMKKHKAEFGDFPKDTIRASGKTVTNPITQAYSDFVGRQAGNPAGLQEELLKIRAGKSSLPMDTQRFIAQLTEQGRGSMGGATEAVDALNAVGGLMGIKKKIPALAGTGFRNVGGAIENSPGIHNALLRTLSTHNFKMPGVGGVLPRLALYAGLPLANWGAGEWMADREKQRKIKEIVNQLGGK
jgi:hypothetical protein